MQEQFRASVQYNDLKGSVAADRSDHNGPEDYLREKGLMKDDDFIVGIELWASENHAVHSDPVTVNFFLLKGGFGSVRNSISSTSEVIATRRISEEMSVAQFLGLFKRFNVMLSPDGMLNERLYSYGD